MASKAYLGDGVYVDFDGFRIVLTTENGRVTNRIVLEPDMYDCLIDWVERKSKGQKEGDHG